MKKTKVLVHYSWWSDSSLTLALAAEKFDIVYVITYNRLAFSWSNDWLKRFNEICSIYWKDKFIKIENYPIWWWYKSLSYESYLTRLKKYKTVASVPCVPCKLSMHWHSIIFCLQQWIKNIADWTVPYMDLYPDQNRKITTDRLIKFYEYFWIKYLQPVYEIAENVEEMLYDKWITVTSKIRWTSNDKQVYCAEQWTFAFFVKYQIDKYWKEYYENILWELTEEKIQYMKKTVKEFLDKNKESFIYNKLLTNEEKQWNIYVGW